MAVTLGARPEHGFDEPLGLLSDCHRRIEGFLGVMRRVVEQTRGATLSPEQCGHLEAALRYFAVAAPRHTEDEEASLFPRLRRSADAGAREAVAKIDALEADHRHAESLHAEAERLCRRWIDSGGPLPADQAWRLGQCLDELRALYARHLAVEDREVFPVAAQALPREDLRRLGAEMAARRGLRPPPAD
jgi:hemerythrin-like domain-containing protein